LPASAAAVLATVSYAGSDDLSPALQRDTICMLNVLKSEPHVGSPELSVSFKDSRKQVTITYKYSDAKGQTSTIGFSSWAESVGGYPEPLFATQHSGMRAVGEPLDDMGTDQVVEDWKTRCAVGAVAISG